jgi:hypothetical protein
VPVVTAILHAARRAAAGRSLSARRDGGIALVRGLVLMGLPFDPDQKAGDSFELDKYVTPSEQEGLYALACTHGLTSFCRYHERAAARPPFLLGGRRLAVGSRFDLPVAPGTPGSHRSYGRRGTTVVTLRVTSYGLDDARGHHLLAVPTYVHPDRVFVGDRPAKARRLWRLTPADLRAAHALRPHKPAPPRRDRAKFEFARHHPDLVPGWPDASRMAWMNAPTLTKYWAAEPSGRRLADWLGVFDYPMPTKTYEALKDRLTRGDESEVGWADRVRAAVDVVKLMKIVKADLAVKERAWRDDRSAARAKKVFARVGSLAGEL